jgi:hypothetical protein
MFIFIFSKKTSDILFYNDSVILLILNTCIKWYYERTVGTFQLHELPISSKLINNFNLVNSRFQHTEFTKSKSWIHEVENVNSRSWSTKREFNDMNSWKHEILRSWKWNREFVKMKSWVSWKWIMTMKSWFHEAEVVKSVCWNHDFVKTNPIIQDVEMSPKVFCRKHSVR